MFSKFKSISKGVSRGMKDFFIRDMVLKDEADSLTISVQNKTERVLSYIVPSKFNYRRRDKMEEKKYEFRKDLLDAFERSAERRRQRREEKNQQKAYELDGFVSLGSEKLEEMINRGRRSLLVAVLATAVAVYGVYSGKNIRKYEKAYNVSLNR